MNYKKMTMELEDEVKKLSSQQNLQQRIHHHAKIKAGYKELRIYRLDISYTYFSFIFLMKYISPNVTGREQSLKITE